MQKLVCVFWAIALAFMFSGCHTRGAINIDSWPDFQPRVEMRIYAADVERGPIERDWAGIPLVISRVTRGSAGFLAVVAVSPYSGCKLRLDQRAGELISDCHGERFDLTGRFIGISSLSAADVEWRYGNLVRPEVRYCAAEGLVVLVSREPFEPPC